MTVRLAQISDFHFTQLTWNPLRLFSKRLLGNLNWVLARKKAFSLEHLQALPSFLQTLALDRILLGGDFTTTSLESEFAIASDFVQKMPAPWIAVPGNHDRYTYRACRRGRFYQYFTNSSSAKFSLQTHGVELHPLAHGWHLIALDTARATPFYTSEGLFSTQLEENLQELLSTIPPQDKILLLNHYPFFENDTPHRSLKRGSALEAIIQQDKRIKAYLHGHTHRHTIANLQQSDLPVVLDGGCSAHFATGSWNLLELDDQGVTIDVYRWKNGWVATKQERIAWTR